MTYLGKNSSLSLFNCSILSAFLLLTSPLIMAQDVKNIIEKGIQEGITVDLREPSYEDGVLSTEKGGVITSSEIRIQAAHIRYTRKIENQNKIWTIQAEGDLIVEFGEYVFVGERLEYNFETREGTIDHGITEIEPWFFGGERFDLRSDGSYVIHNGYVTTSERECPDWGIYSSHVQIEKDRYLRAQNVQFKIARFTVLWVPSLRANLDSIFDSPIRYRFRWGGKQGPRMRVVYEIFSNDNWKTFIRFDYRLTRGPGGGIEMNYLSNDRKTEFHSINYIANDSSILRPREKARFRLEGSYRKLMDQDKTSLLLTYDKISDQDMPSVYYDRDFDFDTAERTQFKFRRQEDSWISNFYMRARINSFQTVKQELPTFETNFKPFVLNRTGIIFENWARASYLNFEYSKHLRDVHNYSSTRFQYFPTLYRPIILGRFATITPEVGMQGIIYGNSPKDHAQWLTQGRAGLHLETRLFRNYGPFKHVIEPYASYLYYTSPTSRPHQHYIFDITDGWTRLNYLTFGANHILYSQAYSKRILSLDLYAFAFFHTRKIHQTIPRIYSTLRFFSLPTLKHTLDAGWNVEHCELDFLNLRTEWTISDDFAISAEYRHRGPYWWRKVDRENFFVDMFHSEKRLLHSALSDRCETFLLHLFYRWHPNWACEFISRQGWNRKREPGYFEFEFDILTTIQTTWNLRFSYQHQEKEDRVAVYLNIGLKRPNQL